MNILYVSVHAKLEFDEVSLFETMGHKVFSVGLFARGRPGEPPPPGDETGITEGGSSLSRDEHFRRVFAETGCRADYPNTAENTVLSDAFIDLFDVIVVMHNLDYISAHWRQLSRRPVVWRTIGQGLFGYEAPARELRAQGLKIVRYSPMEILAPNYAGQDAVIRFCKKSQAFGPWHGGNGKVLQFSWNFEKRYPLEYGLFLSSLQGIPYAIGGPDNDSNPNALGQVSDDVQLASFRDYEAYFHCSAFSIPYNLAFIEAWIAGMPMVVYGDANLRSTPSFEFYEVPRLIESGVDGYVVATPSEARTVFSRLLADRDLARAIGARGRERAMELFSEKVIMTKWARFLDEIVR